MSGFGRRLQQAGGHIVASPSGNISPPGVYMKWGNDQATIDMPFVVGGHTRINWPDIEPTKGSWDWSGLDSELKFFHDNGKPTMIQINSDVKPTWIWNLSGVNKVGTYTKGGTTRDIPRYWEPAFLDAMSEMLNAMGAHLRNSPYKDAILGIRASINCIGTEYWDITDPEATVTDQSVWNEWTRDVGIQCYTDIMRYHNQAFLPEVHTILRSVLFSSLGAPTSIRGELLGQTKGWIFGDVENLDNTSDASDKFYYDWAKSGVTQAMYESLPADSQTHPLSWIYWRHLKDMDRGVTYVASYDNDLVRGNSGQPNYTEYQAIFDFANRNAGWHDKPSTAPAAYIAFRGGSSTYQTNYGIFITQYESNGTPGGDISTVALDSNDGASIIGPTSQRFGRYARRTDTASGKDTFYLRLDSSFKNSLSGSLTVRITYLDSGSNSFTVKWGSLAGAQQTITKTNSGNWVQKSVAISSAANAFKGDLTAGSDILLITSGGNTTFHMVEVIR